VQYDDFVSSVQARGGRPRDETEALVHATLRVLAERLTAGEADDLRAQLPGYLQAGLGCRRARGCARLRVRAAPGQGQPPSGALGRRLHGEIGLIRPAELEDDFYRHDTAATTVPASVPGLH
jgi:Uncharacterized conserved protein (DUF2267)